MRTFILLVFFSICHTLHSQTFQTVVEVQDQCGQLSFMSNQEAEIAVDRILNEFGLTRTFVIQECPDIKNAVAKIVQISPNYKERYIFYDSNFLDEADSGSESKWGAYFILAHEIGHHLNGHSLDIQGSTPPYELEADYFSGSALGLLGASLDEAQRAIEKLITYEKATATHPAKADRLAAIERGWRVAKNKRKSDSKNSITRKVVKIDQGNNIEVFNIDNKKFSSFTNQAIEYNNQKDFFEAGNSLIKAYQYSGGKEHKFLFFAASNYLRVNRNDEALNLYRILVKNGIQTLKKEEQKIVYNNISIIYFNKNQYDDAEKYLEITLGYDPESAGLFFTLNNLFVNKLSSIYSQMQSLDPSSEGYRMLQKEKDITLNKNLEIMNRALQLFPKDPQIPERIERINIQLQAKG